LAFLVKKGGSQETSEQSISTVVVMVVPFGGEDVKLGSKSILKSSVVEQLLIAPESDSRKTAPAELLFWVVAKQALRQPVRAALVNACRTIIIRANSIEPNINTKITGATTAISTATVPRRVAKALFRLMFFGIRWLNLNMMAFRYG
jgi:hypothetical protein